MTDRTLLIAIAAAGLALPAFAQTLPDGPGRDEIRAICTRCHDLSPITGAGFSKEDWVSVVNNMIDMGANITPQQAEVIAEYLAKNFPPKK